MADQPQTNTTQLDRDALHKLTKAVDMMNALTQETGVDLCGYGGQKLAIDDVIIEYGSTGEGHQRRYHLDIRQL